MALRSRVRRVFGGAALACIVASALLSHACSEGPARVRPDAPRRVDVRTDVRTAVLADALPQRLPELDERIDKAMRGVLVPGCGIAVTRGGRLVYERGYGVARPSVATTARTRFRIASLSKAITAVAIHRLVERGELSLDAEVLPLLGIDERPDDPRFDRKWGAIRVRHLLEHSGGWDREQSFDPMFRNAFIGREFGRPLPLPLDALIDYMLRTPLDFEPGTRFAYSNFGYALLGRILERVTHAPYDAWVRTHVLAPMGIARMELGRELPGERPADEAAYFPDRNDPRLPNLFSPGHELVPPSDGGFAMAPMAAHGGWIATATDYARFLVHVDGLPDPPDLLRAESMASMLARPTFEPAGADFYYAHGFEVEHVAGGGTIWSHTGAKPGTVTLAVRTDRGFAYVALCNGRPLDHDFGDVLDHAIVDALAAVTEWPLGTSLAPETDEP